MEKKKVEEMDIVFLLDRSGSIGGVVDDTIGGYNSYLKENRNKPVMVTTVLFDDKYELLHDRVKIDEVNELTDKEYFVRGCTALLDAIGKTIKYFDKKKSKKVMFIITTDGLENASREYSSSQIKEMITGHKDWEFIYIGADIDSYKEGGSIGIKKSNIASYKKDKKGIDKLYGSMSRLTSMFCEEDVIDCSWKVELDEYIKENGE